MQINRETIGQDLATSGSGFAMLATSFGSLAGPPIAGFLYGETDSYRNVFYLAGKKIFYKNSRSLIYCILSFDQCGYATFCCISVHQPVVSLFFLYPPADCMFLFSFVLPCNCIGFLSLSLFQVVVCCPLICLSVHLLTVLFSFCSPGGCMKFCSHSVHQVVV